MPPRLHDRLKKIAQAPCIDSRDLQTGDVFVCLRGSRTDGKRYIDEAVKKGASAIVACGPPAGKYTVPYLQVANAPEALGELSNIHYGYPSSKIHLTGITGTNGKTSVSFLIRNILKAHKAAGTLIGTNAYYVGNRKMASVNTTPNSILINSLLRQSVRRRIRYGVMEVSSHAISQGRIAGIDFNIRILTNITPEHLEYHRSFGAYAQAKMAFFAAARRGGRVIVNIDDPCGSKIAKMKKHKILTYAIISKKADITATNIMLAKNRMCFDLNYRKKVYPVESRLIGTHNVYNIMAAFAFSVCAHIPHKQAFAGIKKTTISGRLEHIPFAGKTIFIDYAHTSDALAFALRTLRPLCAGKLIVVFGCGGNRDVTKRKRMGAIAAKYAETIILTNDNPRDEDPKRIIADIRKGIAKKRETFVILDRAKAIKKGVSEAGKRDIVLIAGKGHETSQVIGKKVLAFNDARCVRRLKRR